MTSVKLGLNLFLFCATLGVAGCGSPTTEGPGKDDITLINNTVSQIPDASSRPQNLKALFAKDGTIPTDADRKRIEKLQFQVLGTPTFKDGVATVEVQVRNSTSPDPLGKVQWTLVKENDQWKLKTTPLP